MIQLGATLRSNVAPRHFWIVLNDPEKAAGQVLLVSLTTLRDSCIDDLCILGPADYSPLTHETTVAFSRFQIGKTSGLERLIAENLFSFVPSVPSTTLRKILMGAYASPELPQAAKGLLPRV
jgi:hypothetical protein